jgi:hypothetical protein
MIVEIKGLPHEKNAQGELEPIEHNPRRSKSTYIPSPDIDERRARLAEILIPLPKIVAEKWR